MQYKCEVFIKGCMGRPSYDGTVEVYSNEDYPDFHELVFQNLKRNSFPEIWRDSVVVKSVKKIGEKYGYYTY